MTIKVREGGIAWQQVDGELIVLDENRSLYIRLAGSASLLWPLLVAGTTIEELATTLTSAFGLSAADAQADARAFVDDLGAHELVVDSE